MRHAPLFVWLALTGAACQGSGDSATTSVRFRWELRYAGSERPGKLTCAQADARRVLFEIRDPLSIDDVDPELPCDQGEAVLPAASAGSFEVFAQAINSESYTGSLTGESVPLFGARVGTVEIEAGRTADFTAVFPLSYFSLDWSIERGGQRLTCEEAGARTIRIETTREFVAPRSFEIPCTGGRGVTGVIPATHYNTVDYTLVGAGGEALATNSHKNILGYPDRFQVHSGEVGNLGRVIFKLR